MPDPRDMPHRASMLSARLLTSWLAVLALALAAPAALLAKAAPRHSRPVAHIALGIPRPVAHIALGIPRTVTRGPIAHVALGIVHADVRYSSRRATSAHRRRHAGGHASAAGSTCANAGTPATSAPASAMRAAVVCLVNQKRAAHGLPALSRSARLDRSAQGWTNTMVSTGQFTHGTNFAGRITATGYNWSFAGENIATGFATPSSVVAGWMASPDHCRNILNPSYADIGVGVNPRPVGSNVTDAATWTQDFGLWMGHAAPSSNTGPMNGCPYSG
jgi:uncharacterized protein YkwD